MSLKSKLAIFRCWFSKRFWDIHDYPDGKEYKQPIHWIEYECERCGKKFYI